MPELQRICDNLQIEYVVVDEAEIDDGWLGKPKGLFQVLWERGWINVTHRKKYVKDKRKGWLDDDGNVKEKFMEQCKTYSLQYLLSQCPDFANERSAMEQLCFDLGVRYGVTIHLLTSPKYHCEIAGEGIENGWGHAKKTYRRVPLSLKRSRDDFWKCVKDSLRKVSVQTMRKFSAKTRRYMMTYQLFDHQGKYAEFENQGLCYSEIEKHVDTILKVHQSSFDQDKGYISQVWRESQQQE